MNAVNIIGRLTKDIELRYTSGNEPKAVVRTNIAVRRDADNADFVPVIIFGKQAENCEKYLKKGSLVGIEGRLQSGKYEKDGKTIYTLDVIANRVEFLQTGENAPKAKTNDPVPEKFEALEDDIPF